MSNEPTPTFSAADQAFAQAYVTRPVWLTYAIVAVNVLIFILMFAASAMPLNSLRDGSEYPVLINFGAKTNFWILNQHHWFRFITPIFLHIGLSHLLVNCYSIWQLGPIVEKLYGGARFSVIYLIAGVGGVIGSLISNAVNKVDIASAGASGAIFGLLGVCLAASYKYRHELPAQFRHALGPGLIPIVIINLAFGFINNALASSGSNGFFARHLIGNAAHIGGLITGFILVFLMPYTIYRNQSQTKAERITIGICIFIVVISFYFAYVMRPFRG